jgi:hypothetical protein
MFTNRTAVIPLRGVDRERKKIVGFNLFRVPGQPPKGAYRGFENYYHFNRLEEEALEGFNPRQVAHMVDSRLLGLGPKRVGDGVAIRGDGRLSAVLKVSSVNLLMATSLEQESIIGGFHGLLRQLPACQVQLKLRVEAANFSKPVERLDYAINRITNPQLSRMARKHRQYLKELERHGLMECNQYVIISQANPGLVKMEQVFENVTGRQGFLGSAPGQLIPELFQNRQPPALDKVKTGWQEGMRNSRSWWTGLFTSKRRRAALSAARKKEHLLQARRESEMEQEFYEELQRSIRNLENCVGVVATGLAGIGLKVWRLPDWELLALYARYLRPELTEKSLLAGRPENVGHNPQSFLVETPPLTLAQFAGNLSSTVVCSQLPGNPVYLAHLQRASEAINQVQAAPLPLREQAAVSDRRRL